MKRLLYYTLVIVFIIFFSSNSTYSQEFRRNENWLLGLYPIVKFEFENKNSIIDTFLKYPTFISFGASNINDTNGNLLFFCNGFYLLDRVGNPMGYPLGNWDSINNALGSKFKKKETGNGDWNQMSIILPKINNQYYVFTTGMSDSAFDQWQSPNANFDSFRFDVLTYHVVDMDGNAGLGTVTSKNNILMRDKYLSHNRMTATRHANGRDWWLVKPAKSEHIFYLWLVTPDSIINYGSKEYLQNGPIYRKGLFGQSAFNMDGSQYAFVVEDDFAGYIFVYNFDRCTGDFSNYKKYNIPINLNIDEWVEGCAFSPNGKYLYVSTHYSIWQVELGNDNLDNAVKVGEYNFQYPKMMTMALAPDGRIYVGNKNAVINKMSYIANPDEPGLACNFVPMGLEQPFTNLLVPPNMPNYGLGVLAGSGCDTIGKKVKASEWLIYPNPATDNLVIESNYLNGAKDVNIVLFNALGQKVLEKKYSNYTWWRIVLGVQELPRGVYLLKITADGNELISKFVAR